MRQIASLVGLHRASGLPMRFVLLRCAGKPDAVIMSTDLALTPREIARLYADRFEIEMTFRELKQHFGLGDYQVRLPEAMLRHVHLSGVACALTQLLTLRPPVRSEGIAAPPKATPWRRGAPISVYETQLQVRMACQSLQPFEHVAAGTADRTNSPHCRAQPVQRPVRPRKCAEL